MQINKTKKAESAEMPAAVTKVEEKKVEERVAIGAHVVYETIRREGEDELKRPTSGLAWSGLAAGLSMGFSLVAEGLLAAYLPDRPWSPLISKFGYSVGFLIVVLGRQQLYTETTLTAVLPLLSHTKAATALSVLRLWAVVLASNLVGTYLFALCIGRIHIFDAHVQATLIGVSRSATGASFWIVMVRAVFAGWLIALMVWLLPVAETSRVSIIVIITYLIGLGGFAHIIAGSNKLFFLVVAGVETWKNYVTGFFIPTLIGNAIGGVSLVAFLGHAQVTPGKATRGESEHVH
jgi:formate-nitrite transporter family protein